MGLFPGNRRLFRSTEFHAPIRLHSEYSLASLGRVVSRLGQRLRSLAVGATNDARIVGAVLLLAAAALAFEMARAFPR